jgi:hypothetical protein
VPDRIPPWNQAYKMHLTLQEYTTETVHHRLLAGITESGDLIVYGHDSGSFVKNSWNYAHYYWWLTVRSEYKDWVLLWVLKKAITGEVELKDWLNDQAVPFEFDVWPSNVDFSDPT